MARKTATSPAEQLSEMSLAIMSLAKAGIRPKTATEKETTTATAVCQWMMRNSSELRWVSTPAETDLWGCVVNHWMDHGVAPSMAILQHPDSDLCERSRTGLETLLSLTDLVRLEVADLPALLTDLQDQRADALAAKTYGIAAVIAKSGARIKRSGVEVLAKGAADSHRYVADERPRMSVRPGDTDTTEGPIQELPSSYWVDKVFPLASNAPAILTGIAQVDKFVHLEHGMLVGLLGYAKAGKSRGGRTIAYNAAAAGLRVIHVTTEMQPVEELAIYGCRHAWALDPKLAAALKINTTTVANKAYNEKARAYLTGPVFKSLTGGGLPGQLEVWAAQPGETWRSLQARLQATALDDKPVDVVYIDYLQALHVDPKHEREETEAAVRDAQEFARTYAGKGCLVITPLQANRAGAVSAKAKGGKFELDAVLQHSSYDRYCSLILSVFQDEDMKQAGVVVLATSAMRHGAGLQPVRVPVHLETQMFGVDSAYTERGMDGYLNTDKVFDTL